MQTLRQRSNILYSVSVMQLAITNEDLKLGLSAKVNLRDIVTSELKWTSIWESSKVTRKL